MDTHEFDKVQATPPETKAASPRLSPLQKLYYSSGCLFELTKGIIVLIVIGTLVHFYFATISIVEGQSMEPNFHTGEFMIADRWHYTIGSPQRGDPVILRFPGDPEHTKYIKRVVGLPGETVEIRNGLIYVNGEKLPEPYLPPGIYTSPDLKKELQGDDYFLLGDNRANSSDSRVWGICPKRDIIGKAYFIFWPLQYWGKVEKVQQIQVK